VRGRRPMSPIDPHTMLGSVRFGAVQSTTGWCLAYCPCGFETSSITWSKLNLFLSLLAAGTIYLARAESNSRFNCSAQPLSMSLAAARLDTDVAHCMVEDPLRR
jgi:hypothetical protein